MLDLLEDNNLENTFYKYIKYRGEYSEFAIIGNILSVQDNIPPYNKSDIQTQLSKLGDRCKKRADLFEYDPSEVTALEDTFFGLSKNTDSSQKTSHIFYVNPTMSDRVRFVARFLKECVAHHVSFDFEYTINENFTNGISIYATDQQLPQYIDIFSRLEHDYPSMIEHCGKTPLNAEHVSWYSYGNIKDKVCPAVYAGFTKTLMDYYQQNVDKIDSALLIQNIFNVLNKRTARTNFGRIQDEVLQFNLYKHKAEIIDSIQKGFSLKDIADNSPIMTIKGDLVGEAVLTPCNLAEAMRLSGIHIQGRAQKDKLSNELHYNTERALALYNVKCTLPAPLRTVKQQFGNKYGTLSLKRSKNSVI